MSEFPFMRFFPSDWRGDPKLRLCGLPARGLWIEMLALMHEGEPYGHLLLNGKPPTPAELARLVGAPTIEVQRLLKELRDHDVSATTPKGVIYSRRMVRDAERARAAREHGRKGGNPLLQPSDKGRDKGRDNRRLKGQVNRHVNGGVGPMVRTRSQIPDPRSQRPEESTRAHAKCLRPCRRICYPQQLAEAHAQQLGGNHEEALNRLRTFRDQVIDGIPPDQPIGDDRFKFWREHFAARFPSATPHRRPRPEDNGGPRQEAGRTGPAAPGKYDRITNRGEDAD